MDEGYEIKITPYALHQMMETVQYISISLQAPETAAKWLDTIEAEIQSLAFLPARIPLTPEEPWRSQGIHRMVVKNFFVYFWIDPERARVWVTAVTYVRRSQKQQLEWMELP